MCAHDTNSMVCNFKLFGTSFTISWVTEEFKYQNRPAEIKNKVLKSVNFNKITLLNKKSLGESRPCPLVLPLKNER